MAFLYSGADSFHRFSIRIYPGALIHVKYGRQFQITGSWVGTNPPIVMDCYFFAYIGFGSAISHFYPVIFESARDMGAVAERLASALAASTQARRGFYLDCGTETVD